jgi:hypothetical protein
MRWRGVERCVRCATPSESAQENGNQLIGILERGTIGVVQVFCFPFSSKPHSIYLLQYGQFTCLGRLLAPPSRGWGRLLLPDQIRLLPQGNSKRPLLRMGPQERAQARQRA